MEAPKVPEPETKEKPPVKVPKKRGRKPKYPPESRKIVFHNGPVVITFD